MGNHDYGGSDFICYNDGETAECKDSSALLQALDQKFKWQSEYTSSNSDRWSLKDHFYVTTLEDKDSGVTIEIYNIDTNDASAHGMIETCCQCYGYAEGDDDSCDNVARGDKFCCGGDTDMYDACIDAFDAWGEQTRSNLTEKASASKATWKIINTHYSPYEHYTQELMETWFKILKKAGIHLWMHGHTHGEKHDYSSTTKTHFVENGAGGGIQKSSAGGIPTYATDYVENVWSYTGDEYGFFSVTAGEEWLKLQYHTADDKWVYADEWSSVTKGGVATKHCWYIPVDGGAGQTCDSSTSS